MNQEEASHSIRALLDQPNAHFGQPLSPEHRHALEYVLGGDAASRAAMLRHGRPSLCDELLPPGFRGFPALPDAVAPRPESARLLEALLLSGSHRNLAAWVAPIGNPELLRHMEERSEALGLAKAEIAAIVIDTLPSVANVAETWLWRLRDSVLDAAMRRIRSDEGLACFVRFAAADDQARLHQLASRRLNHSKVFDGRIAMALLSAGDPFVALVESGAWRSLAPAAKLHWGLQFERAGAPAMAFAPEMERTIQAAMAAPAFFETPQAGWVAGVALRRHGARYLPAILAGVRRLKNPLNFVLSLGKLRTETDEAAVLNLAVEILTSLPNGGKPNDELREALQEAIAALRNGR